MKISLIKDLNLKNKRVFLRADLNIPLDNGKILQDFRLKAILPTIDYIQKNGGKVILATHIGRPRPAGQTDFFDDNLTTKLLIPWFNKHEYQIQYAQDLISAERFSHLDFSKILLLENLRFFNGEKGNPKNRMQFAKNLKNLTDIYINDAFALVHRQDSSITLLPDLFEPQKKAFGFRPLFTGVIDFNWSFWVNKKSFQF